MNHSMFIHSNEIIIVVYVDDLLIIEFNFDDIIELKKAIFRRFKLKNLEDISHYLDVKVMRDRKNLTMWLTQTSYIKKLVDDCGLTNCRPISTSMKPYFLKTNIHNDESYTTTVNEIQSYNEILRSLQWLVVMTRQDIVFATNKLTQFNQNFTFTHFKALHHVVKYLTETSKLNIRYEFSSNFDDELRAYIDFVYKNDVDTSRFHFDYVFMFWNESISCFSKRQTTIATSTTKIEYIDECNTAKEIYFLVEMFKELDWKCQRSIIIRADNQSAIKLTNNLISHARIKHISIQYHYIREQVELSNVILKYLSIKNMIADDLTKTLKKELFQKFVSMLELTNSDNNSSQRSWAYEYERW